MTPAATPRVHVRLLGAMEVTVDGAAVPLGGPRPRSLIGVLALAGGQPVSTGRLVDTLWDGDPPASGANAVQVYVSRLRRAIAARGATGTLRAAGGGYLLDVEPDAVDVLRFERLADAGHARLLSGDAAEASRLLREALQLWRGPALPDLAELSSSEGLLARLEARRMAALADRFDADAALGRTSVLVPELQEAVRVHPLDERFVGQLVTALYRSGRQTEALAAYTAAANRLADELGIDPGPALRQLHGEVLRQEVSLRDEAPAAEPAPAHAALPPQPRQGPLERAPTPLVGRDAELSQVIQLLGREDVRLLTVLGPGGTGKTRLAGAIVEAVRALDGGPDVVVVPLAAVTEPAGLLPAVLRASGGNPDWAGADPLATACRVLSGRPVLLVLDNLEQLIDAPGGGDAVDMVVALLDALPELSVLGTSRSVLHVRGEQVLPLTPLATPDPADGDALEVVRRSPAVQLFADRARAASPAFELTGQNAGSVAELCRMLDGLPLALELAAARVRLIPPEQMLDRADHRLRLLTGGPRDLPQRQRSMRDTLDWSAQLLDGAEVRLFGQLSVFHGGWTLQAAERVADLGDDDAVDVLSRLVDRSLVTTDGEGRLGMLETIREYAAERLAAAGEGDRRAAAYRHAAYFAQFAEEYGPMYRTSAVHADRERMNAEDANLTAALRHAQAGSDMTMLARLVVGLLDYWFYSGQLAQADRWVAVVRDAEVDAEVRVRLLLSTGSLVLLQGADLPRARAALDAANAAAIELGDPLLVARGLAIGAMAARYSGEIDRALGLIEEAIVLAREAGRPALEEQLHNERGEVLDALGRTDEAVPLWQRFAAWTGDWQEERAYPLSNLALHAQEAGDAETASALITDALHSAVAGDAVPLRADTYVAAGLLELLAGRASRAVDLLQEGLRLGHDCGQLLTMADTVSLLGAALVGAGDVDAGARLLGAGDAWRAARGLRVVGRLPKRAIDDAGAVLAAAMPAERLDVQLRRGGRAPFGSLGALQELVPAVVELRGVVIDLDSTAPSRAP